jgi:effector-binding domain-containing protein
MFKIGDFSSLSRVSVKTLRYYDEIGLLKPAEIDRYTGYRYYSAEQLPRLNRIVALKELGFSLEGISGLLSDDLSFADIRDILRGRQAGIERQLRDAETRMARLEEWLTQIEKEGKMPEYQVTIKKTESLLVATVRDIIPSYSAVSNLYNELFAVLGKAGVWPAGPPMVIYHDIEYKECDNDMEAAVPVSREINSSGRVKVYKLPEITQVACVVHHGEYTKFSQAYQAIMPWIERNGYHITGNIREIYLQGPGQGKEPKDYVTEIQIPVEKS